MGEVLNTTAGMEPAPHDASYGHECVEQPQPPSPTETIAYASPEPQTDEDQADDTDSSASVTLGSQDTEPNASPGRRPATDAVARAVNSQGAALRNTAGASSSAAPSTAVASSSN